MGFFEDLAKKFGEAADTAHGYADRTGTIARLKYRRARAAKRADEAYGRLGKSYYENMKNSTEGEQGDDGADFFNFKADREALCSEIEKASAEMAELDGLIRDAEKKNICPACGASVGVRASVCRKCGTVIR